MEVKLLQKDYIVLIPAYKPTDKLLQLLTKFYNLCFNIVLVDDGSGVAYEKLFFECSRYAEVLHHMQNLGKGCALKTGLKYIAKHYSANSIIVTVDADGQHRVDDALAVCQIAEQHPNSFVLGSRRLKENVPLRSKFGNTLTRFIYHISTGIRIHDTQTGLRAFHGNFISKLLEISGERYEYEMNVLLHFANERIPIIEHEIETIYFGNNSQSHFDVLRDSIRIYKEILKFSLSSLIGFLVDYMTYSLLLLLTKNLRISNIIARIISASVNFSLNRKFVFRSTENILKSATKYFLLATGILLGNTLFLELLVNTFEMHQLLAKIATELLFFMISWLFQRIIIFKNRR